MPSVLTIFNNVIGALLENSKRRFVMVEMSFIWRWWKRLDDDYKQIIRKLMNEGKFYLLDFGLKVRLMIFQDVLI
jgi:hypothetical protein